MTSTTSDESRALRAYELLDQHPELSDREIAKRVGFKSHTSVARLRHDEASADGSRGRPRSLPDQGELAIMDMVQDATAQGKRVSGKAFQKMCVAMWRELNPGRSEDDAPSFGKHYRKSLQRRYHKRLLRFRPVLVKPARRLKAQTRSNVERSLQKNHRALERNFFGGRLAAKWFWFVDEIALGSLNHVTGGVPALSVGQTRPFAMTEGESRMITYAPVVNLLGDVMLHAFIVSGSATISETLLKDMEDLAPGRVLVAYNSSSRMTKSDGEGLGVCELVVDRLVALAADAPKVGDKKFGAMLVFDRLSAHLDELASARLEAGGDTTARHQCELDALYPTPGPQPCVWALLGAVPQRTHEVGDDPRGHAVRASDVPSDARRKGGVSDEQHARGRKGDWDRAAPT